MLLSDSPQNAVPANPIWKRVLGWFSKPVAPKGESDPPPQPLKDLAQTQVPLGGRSLALRETGESGPEGPPPWKVIDKNHYRPSARSPALRRLAAICGKPGAAPAIFRGQVKLGQTQGRPLPAKPSPRRPGVIQRPTAQTSDDFRNEPHANHHAPSMNTINPPPDDKLRRSPLLKILAQPCHRLLGLRGAACSQNANGPWNDTSAPREARSKGRRQISSQGMSLRVAAALALAAMGGTAAQAQVQLSASRPSGTPAPSPLDIYVGPTSSVQILRGGASQVYHPSYSSGVNLWNSISMAVGTTMYKSNASAITFAGTVWTGTFAPVTAMSLN